MFFSSNRPRQGDAPAADYDIWLVERLGKDGSVPWLLPEPVNGTGDQWRASQ